MARVKFAPGVESKEKESSKKRREGSAVKCEQFRGYDIARTKLKARAAAPKQKKEDKNNRPDDSDEIDLI